MNEIFKPPLFGMKEIPYGLPLMYDAWVGCVTWAIGKPEIRNQFNIDTGIDLNLLIQDSFKYDLGSSDRQISKEDFIHNNRVMTDFCDWVTVNIWGVDDESEKI